MKHVLLHNPLSLELFCVSMNGNYTPPVAPSKTFQSFLTLLLHMTMSTFSANPVGCPFSVALLENPTPVTTTLDQVTSHLDYSSSCLTSALLHPQSVLNISIRTISLKH